MSKFLKKSLKFRKKYMTFLIFEKKSEIKILKIKIK